MAQNVDYQSETDLEAKDAPGASSAPGVQDTATAAEQDPDTGTVKDSASAAHESNAVARVRTSEEENAEATKVQDYKPTIKLRYVGNLREVFNDSNYLQLEHAERLGITPVTDLRSLYRTRRPLVKIENNKDFTIDKLTHSFPFLVPEASRLLHDIGRTFRDSLIARGGKDYRIVVTSVLRTPASVKKLRRVNRNAVENSTHQYATTFDITYNRFSAPDGRTFVASTELKALLAEVIYNLQQEGRCCVKYEVKSPCFHITVAR